MAHDTTSGVDQSGQVVSFPGRFVSPEVRKLRSEQPPFRRGVVLSCPLHVDEVNNSVCDYGQPFDNEELLRAVLLWDRCVVPENGFVRFPRNADLEFLESTGFLQRMHFPGDGGVAGVVANSYRNCFVTLEARNPGAWAISGEENGIEFRNQDFAKGRGALVAIHNAIPVPVDGAPLAEAMELKHKRRDELDALREALDPFFDNWLHAEDRAHALNSAILRIERACSDATKAVREFRFPTKLVTLSIGYAMTGMAALTFYETVKSGLTDPYLTTVNSLTGILGANLIRITPSGAPELKSRKASPYRYAAIIASHFR